MTKKEMLTLLDALLLVTQAIEQQQSLLIAQGALLLQLRNHFLPAKSD